MNGESPRRFKSFRYTSNGPVPIYNEPKPKKISDHSILWFWFYVGLFAILVLFFLSKTM